MRAVALLAAAAIAAQAQAPYERIRNAGSEPGNWLTYSGTYAGHRFSALDQITPANVATLKPVWVYQASDLNKFETSPIPATRSRRGMMTQSCSVRSSMRLLVPSPTTW